MIKWNFYISSHIFPNFVLYNLNISFEKISNICVKESGCLKYYYVYKDLLGKYSMDTIASCAFGVDSQAFTNKDSKFVEFASNIFKQTFTDAAKFMLMMVPLDLG